MSGHQRVVFVSRVTPSNFNATHVRQMGFHFNFYWASVRTMDQSTITESIDNRLPTDGFRPMWRVE